MVSVSPLGLLEGNQPGSYGARELCAPCTSRKDVQEWIHTNIFEALHRWRCWGFKEISNSLSGDVVVCETWGLMRGVRCWRWWGWPVSPTQLMVLVAWGVGARSHGSCQASLVQRGAWPIWVTLLLGFAVGSCKTKGGMTCSHSHFNSSDPSFSVWKTFFLAQKIAPDLHHITSACTKIFVVSCCDTFIAVRTEFVTRRCVGKAELELDGVDDIPLLPTFRR